MKTSPKCSAVSFVITAFLCLQLSILQMAARGEGHLGAPTSHPPQSRAPHLVACLKLVFVPWCGCGAPLQLHSTMIPTLPCLRAAGAGSCAPYGCLSVHLYVAEVCSWLLGAITNTLRLLSCELLGNIVVYTYGSTSRNRQLLYLIEVSS